MNLNPEVQDVQQSLSERDACLQGGATLSKGELSSIGSLRWVSASEPVATTRMKLVSLAAPWFKGTVERMADLLALPANWDGYGARKIDRRTVQKAIEFLARLSNQTLEPSIIPTSEGGIQLEWHLRGIDLEIELRPSGRQRVSLEEAARGTDLEEEGESAVERAEGVIATRLTCDPATTG